MARRSPWSPPAGHGARGACDAGPSRGQLQIRQPLEEHRALVARIPALPAANLALDRNVKPADEAINDVLMHAGVPVPNDRLDAAEHPATERDGLLVLA